VSVFKDQKKFMDVTGQTPSVANEDLYMKLIMEEFAETMEAYAKYKQDRTDLSAQTEVVDGCLDVIYVACGLMHSMGLDPQPLWDEVQASNMSKFDRTPFGDYIVHRREDGKIMKGPNYFKPNLLRIVREQSGAGG